MKNNSFIKLINKSVTNKPVLFLGIGLGLLGSILQLGIPQLAGQIAAPHFLNYTIKHPQILLLGIVFLISVFVIQGIGTWLLGTIGANSIKNLQTIFVKHVINLPVNDIEKLSSGDVGSRLTNDISEVSKIISVIIPQLIINLVIITGSVVFLLRINLKITILILFLIPVIFLTSAPFNKKIEKIATSHQKYLGNISNEFTQKLRNIKIVKVFLGENDEINNFQVLFDKLAKNMKKIILSMTTLNTIVSSALMIVIITILFIASFNVSKGTMTISSLVTFTLYLMQILSPMSELLNDISEVFESKGSLNRVAEILNIETKAPAEEKKYSLKTGVINFKNVSFSYNNKEDVLKNIDMTINPGEFVALVGPSGAGKSTTLSLLLKFYSQYKGEILIDDKPLKNINDASLLNQIAYVPQKNNLFSGSIISNLKYGKNKNVDSDKLMNALNQIDPTTFTKKLTEGLNTELKEDGDGLSEGQKQKLNVIRAFLSDSQLILLDEITSNLDTDSEEAIMSFINKYKHQKTIIMIAHRLKTVENANKIYLFNDSGEIVDCGTHDELLTNNPEYKQFYTRNVNTQLISV